MDSGVNILEGLNREQHQAVTHTGAPLQVVAGAGSGKTRILTHRIAHLMDYHGVSPFEILAITFTNKAANEMKHRVASLVGSVANSMWVSTFHSACVKILRIEAEHTNYPAHFTIYDQSEAVRLCGYVITDIGLDKHRFPPRKVHAAISAAKNENISADVYLERASDPYKARVAQIFKQYQSRLVAAAAMDFDDLLICTVELFNNHADVLKRWQQRFQHVLVDEYQDTNKVQNELVIQLASANHQVTVVGDSDQSIYAFRGADIRNFLEFETAFPDVYTVVLNRNYRSTQNILSAANSVIAGNTQRPSKNLWTATGDGVPITCYTADDEKDEARYVANNIKRIRDVKRAGWHEMAVLYRTNAQSRAVEQALVEANIPYKMLGGTGFYHRREIRDIVAYLKVVANRYDELSTKRVLNVPKRGIGVASINKIEAHKLSSFKPTFWDALCDYQQAGVTGKAASGIEQFLALIEDMRKIDKGVSEIDKGVSSDAAGTPSTVSTSSDADATPIYAGVPSEIISQILQRSGYMSELESERTVESDQRIDNLQELQNVACDHVSLRGFLEDVVLVADTDDWSSDIDFAASDKKTESCVTLMTLHAAKGLEYPYVYLVGMEEGILPHERSISEPSQVEEERRLTYVGITRAMQSLTVTHCERRTIYGRATYAQNQNAQAYRGRHLSGQNYRRSMPSRFLEEIPEELIEMESFDGSIGWNVSSRHDIRRSSTRDTRSAERLSSRHRYSAERRSGHITDGSAPTSSTNLNMHKPKGQQLQGLRVGDAVCHTKWGEGVVTDMNGSGGSTQIEVLFKSVGSKLLLMSAAPIQKC